MKKHEKLAKTRLMPVVKYGRARRTARCSLAIKLPDTGRSALRTEFSIHIPGANEPSARKSTGKLRCADRLAAVLASLGHPIRLQVAAFLLGGSASYEELTQVTSMRSGPLYFHLQQLRSAGLIGPRRRDDYSLTKYGRAMVMAMMTIQKLRR